jgi:hypothetical protein
MAASNHGGVEARRAERAALEAMVPEGTPVFVYSGQRLEFSGLQRQELNKELAAQPGRYFAYGTEFLSQGVEVRRVGRVAVHALFVSQTAAQPLDAEDLKKQEKLESTRRFMTKVRRWCRAAL